MPEETDYGRRDTNDEVEAQIREEKQERAEETNLHVVWEIRGDAGYYLGEEIGRRRFNTAADEVLAIELISRERERCAKVAENASAEFASAVGVEVLDPKFQGIRKKHGAYIAYKIRSGE